MPAIAFAAIPPGLWRVARYMSQYSFSMGRGSWPSSNDLRSSTQPAMARGVRLSLHSP